MSSDSLALLRKNTSTELVNLAEEHFKHDLRDSDRDALRRAARKLSTHTTIGSLLGLGLGIALAWRLRQIRMNYFNMFKAVEKPTHVKFAGGREEPLPDMTALMRPTALGDVATYLLFSTGGLFIGGELGLLTGSWSASRTITRDTAMRERIETAFRRFRADWLRKEAEALDGGRKTGLGLGL